MKEAVRMISFQLLFLSTFLTAVLTAPTDTHIVGGSVSKLGDWKWQGSIQYMFGKLHYCGAAVISEKWILTSAHCVANSPFAYHLVAGLYDNDDWTKGKPELYYFHGVYKHPEYERGRNDLAVIEMSGSGVDLTNPYIHTIQLANTSANYEGWQCYITGWGATKAGSKDASPRPMEAEVRVISNTECGQDWPGVIHDDHICIAAGQSSLCHADTGAPLVCKNDEGGWELAGLGSWGPEDCNLNTTSVFTRISHLREWIDEEMQE